jgi:thiosulfate reductase cytochrome b subunit
MTIMKLHAKRIPGLLLTIGLYLIAVGVAVASSDAPPPAEPRAAAVSPLHPAFVLLDADGQPVLTSGQPLSTMTTCGSCHDTAFIAEHSFHADVGLSEQASGASSAHPWDGGPGYFGRWNPILYRTLTASGSAYPDLFTADWIAALGARHVGGGPAQTSRSGVPLAESTAEEDAQTASTDGTLSPWDWDASGTVEMNCFLCHIQVPDNAARIAALEAGEFAWASTATLLGTGIVTRDASGAYAWDAGAFDDLGQLDPARIGIQDPRSDNCGQCHGVVHTDPQAPLTAAAFDGAWQTLVTGQIVSPQRMSSSGLNLAGKADLTRSFDIHAERVLSCTDCHYALNNPVFFQTGSDLDHLTFDPRRLNFGDYLYQPLHQFAKGQSASGGSAPELDNTLRRCEGCHDAATAHGDWLPYTERHMSAMTCETCHIPQVYGPALASVDWTLLNADGSPLQTYRSVDGGASPDGESLLVGYTPVLLPRQNAAGDVAIAPYNLVSAWYWVAGSPEQPVPLRLLQAALLTPDGGYAPDVRAALDVDGDGALGADELRLDTPEKTAAVAAALESAGVSQPRIASEIQPYGLHHGVTGGQWAIKDCQTCHADESRLRTPILLAGYTPGGVEPQFIGGDDVAAGRLESVDGALYYAPASDQAPANLYIFGHDRVDWIDTFGLLAFVGVLLGVFLHGGLRVLAGRRLARHAPEAHQRVYMYGVYERFWHWLQTAVILGLIFTGLVIHRPEQFSLFSFAWTVTVHNILAAILVVNAALSLFYHVASGEIRQYIPRPVGFFDQAIVQAKYYLSGIFRGAPHPFEKAPERKLNPLQQLTYFGILNVLLPLQILTGVLMWGKQQFPELTLSLGGLPFLAPFHTLIAWTFASFVVMHVYLTTTGSSPLANIKAMMLGWEGEAASDSAPAAHSTLNPQEEGTR